jgi:peptide/nickel transport system substrate-binding protein
MSGRGRFLLATLLAAVSLAAAGQPKILRYASQVDPGTMDPHAIASLYNTRVLNQIYEVLVGRDEQFKIEPRLALSWAPLEDKGWRFKLRPGVKFHDGAPFTADDVVFTVERALAPTSQIRVALPNVTAARKVDDLTVDLMTSTSTPVLPLALTNLRIMNKAWAVKHHVEKPQNFAAKEETFATRNANGTGPFVLKEWVADVKTVLVANPAYWGRHGNVTEARFLVVGSAATRVSGLLSGELDFVVDPAFQDVEKLRQDPAIKIGTGMGTGAQFLAFDYSRDKLLYGDAQGRNPFRDVRVRRALRHALDLPALQSKVMRNLSTVGTTIFTPLIDAWEPRFERLARYDPEAAKALLKEAGYPNGFSVTLDCSAQTPTDALCQAIAGMLARVGIRVTYQPLQFNVLLPKLTARDSSMWVIGWTPLTAEAEGVMVPLAHTPNGKDGEYNFGRYSNAKVDALIDRARNEPLGEKRRQMFTEAAVLMDEDSAFIPTAYRKVVWAMRKNVRTPVMPNDQLDLRFVNID